MWLILIHYYIYKSHSKKECVQKRPRAKPKIIQKVRVLKHSCEHLQIKTSTWFYSLPHPEAKATFAKSWGSYRAVSSSQVPYNFHIIFFITFMCRFSKEEHHKPHIPALQVSSTQIQRTKSVAHHTLESSVLQAIMKVKCGLDFSGLGLLQ